MPDPVFESFAAERLIEILGIQPVATDPGDRPDLVLQMPDYRIGLEVCEATPEEYHRGRKALQAEGWQGCVSPGNWQHRTEHRATKELREEGKGPVVWVDATDAMSAWSQGLLKRLSDKERAFSHPGFRKFDRNWLLIADIRTTPVTHEPDIIEMKEVLRDLVRSFRPASFFDSTFIDFGADAGLVEWDHASQSASWSISQTRNISIS